MIHDITLEQYLRDPCGTSSLPWWKNCGITLPEGMKVVHERDFSPDRAGERRTERYFRLIHRFESVAAPELPDGVSICPADTAQPGIIADFINRCYSDISVTEAQVLEWTRRAVYDGALWIFAYDGARPAALAIAEIGLNVGEAALEWVQTLPEARGRGLAGVLVRELLARAKARGAQFATVSGQLENRTNPEALYRKCGFEGRDVWCIIK